MNLHLVEIATEIAPGKHAILLLDQVGWHLSSRLMVPTNMIESYNAEHEADIEIRQVKYLNNIVE